MIFLRPWWLLALLIPLVFWGFRQKTVGQNPWQQVIDKKLLKALTLPTKQSFSKTGLSKLALLLWGLMVLALAGPSWDKIPVPSAQVKPNSVIVLDLNKDLTDKQLKQIHLKLYDLLQLLKENRVGLVLFGQTKGYTAMPLTPDIQLISNLIPSLVPSVLPQNATNIQAGIQEAEKMLTRTGNQGRLIVISDKKFHSSFPAFSFNPEKDSLIQLAKNIQKNSPLLLDTAPGETPVDVWYDRGIWLALLALIPACLLFRKNVLFIWIILGISFPCEAGWFQTKEQENYALNQAGIQEYRAQNYMRAEENFKKANHPYNQGNALAYQGKIQEAIHAYQQALKINPKDKDALFNKEYLEQQLKQNQSESKNSNADKSPQKSDSNSHEKASEENNSDGESDKNQEKQDDNSPTQENAPQPTQDETQQELEQALAQDTPEEPFNQEEQQILNRLNRDPARVLRYRIHLQHQRGFMS